MRSFGMLDDAASGPAARPQDSSENSHSFSLQLQSNATDEGKTEAEKADAQLETEDVDGKMIVEEEERYDDKVDEAVRDGAKPVALE